MSGNVIVIDVMSWDGSCSSSWTGPAYRWCAMIVTLYFFCSEIDRRAAIEDEKEAEQLRNRFDSVAAAECSCKRDEQTIKAEICGDVGDVDMAVSVLLSAGMSTPELRTAAELGASVHSAGHISATSVVVFAGFSVILQILFFSSVGEGKEFEVMIWTLVNLGTAISYARLFYKRRQRDQQAFILASTGKFLIVGLQLLFMTIDPEIEDGEDLTFMLLVFLFFFIGPSLLLSWLGPVRISRIPLLGPLVAGLIGPGTSCRSFRLLSNSDMEGGAPERWAYSASATE